MKTPRARPGCLVTVLNLVALVSCVVVGCGSAAGDAREVAPAAPPAPPVSLPAALELELEATGGFSPWSRVRYALEQVRGQPMLVHERDYYGGYDDGEPPRRALLGEARWAALHAGLEACRLGALEGATEAPLRPADARPEWLWRVRWRDAAAPASEAHEVWLSDAEARLWPCLRLVEDVVARETEPIGFARVYVAEAERGLLDVRTVPEARVYVDGVELGTTPLWGVALPAGEHEVRLVNEAEGLERRLEVVVEQGVKTLLELELR